MEIIRTQASPGAIQTHPSVRLKGTELNYTPQSCIDQTCANRNSVHYHCPLCTKADSYGDPVILKAHFRVKHVDKSIEFAGLKVLRCCKSCEIVGVIKGEKRFKGAHWHCYRCRNGFNRRDEAVKHYKTHFRHPQTTFQIQIPNELMDPEPGDSLLEASSASHTLTTTTSQFSSIHPVLTEAVMTTAQLTNDGKGETAVPNGVAANEIVATTDGQTYVIIPENAQGDLGADHCEVVSYEAQSDMVDAHGLSQDDLEGTLTQDNIIRLLEQRRQLQTEVEQLQAQNQQLQVDRENMEKQLREEIAQLKQQVQDLSSSSPSLSDRQRTQQEHPEDTQVQELIEKLNREHRQLLEQQVALLRQQDQGKHQASHPILVTMLSPSESGTTTSQENDQSVSTSSQLSQQQVQFQTLYVTHNMHGDSNGPENDSRDLMASDGVSESSNVIMDVGEDSHQLLVDSIDVRIDKRKSEDALLEEPNKRRKDSP
ncbi:uncharacterized protein LOC118426759 [Branchiostoma floridae]|uniref:Uncharacterized protein LOC118426759 n=1 Tax=Branchiostoma floridae TaxID=7739 RepID=C3ZHT3_BRAFL|nr:uncharacterized protein LOC118426759 [Branchiostoma floridae]|eukprot:XP_002591866.1 hypothetical protein BRAFLDRAFT_125516 [Branchiostoma floridae]